MTKVYVVVSRNLLEYIPSMHVCHVYSTHEAAEKHLPENDDFNEYEINEWEVLDE